MEIRTNQNQVEESVHRLDTDTLVHFQIRMTLEVRDAEHGAKLREALEANYEEVFWGEDRTFALNRPTLS